jgi:hypothetical protein
MLPQKADAMTPPTNAFIFAPTYNQPPDTANPYGNDATGAFQPGADQFEAFCDNTGTATQYRFNNHASDRSRLDEITHAMQTTPGRFDTIAYFGHGIKELMVSAGIGQGFLDEFVGVLRANCTSNAVIILYACSCGAPGGIAEQIAAKLSDMSVTTYSHASAGHAFRNPMVREFPGGIHVAPADCIQAWLDAFKDESNDLWKRFPFMTADEIHDELS